MKPLRAANTRRTIRRVAMISVHTSPLAQPGSGDAGGMNVYVDQVARRLARRGIEVEVFTRATSSEQPPTVEPEPGYTVRHVLAGPYDGLLKEDLPSQLCPFAANVLRAATPDSASRYDVVHSHYWLSGQVGYLVRDRWGIPLVHSAHTLAKVKNASLAGDDDAREPDVRVIGEEQVAAEADLLLAATHTEAEQLQQLYGAAPTRVAVVHPGVDTQLFRPDRLATISTAAAGAAAINGTAAINGAPLAPAALRAEERALLGLAPDDVVIVFAGRIQPHKGPEVVVRALAAMREHTPGRSIKALIVGDASGAGRVAPRRLHELAAALHVQDAVQFLPALPPANLARVFRVADVVAVPSYSESFGLVALEAQACGTPVVAAAVGGLPVAVRDGHSGLLVDGHGTAQWQQALSAIALNPELRARMSIAARAHAERFSWDATVDALQEVYLQAANAPASPLEVGA